MRRSLYVRFRSCEARRAGPLRKPGWENSRGSVLTSREERRFRMKENLKRKVSCLLAVLLMLTAILSEVGLTVVKADNGQQEYGSVTINLQAEQEQALEPGETHIVHVSAQSSSTEAALLNIYLKNAQDAPDLEASAGLAEGTASDLSAEWKEDRDEAGNVTARYLQVSVPAGAAAAFDVELQYDTEAEACQKQVKVEAQACVNDTDVTVYDGENNRTSVSWVKEAAKEDGTSDDAALNSTLDDAASNGTSGDAASNETSDDTADDGESEDDETENVEGTAVKKAMAASAVMALSDAEDSEVIVYLVGNTLDGWIASGYTVRLNAKRGNVDGDGWSIIAMTDSGKTINNNTVYVAKISETDIPFGGFATMQFQALDNGTFKEECVVNIAGNWISSDDFNNKVYDLDGGSWSDPTFDIRSYEGETVYFMNMDPDSSLSDIKALFSVGTADTAIEAINMTSAGFEGLYQVTVPGDTDDVIYDTVTFFSGDTKLAEEKIIDGDYVPEDTNTFYYHVTKKSDDSYVNQWNKKPEDNSSVNDKTLYLDKIFFSVNASASIRLGAGDAEVLQADSDDSATYSYEITNASATQQTIFTVTVNKTEYHFLWSDLGNNLVTVNSEIASVSGTYVKTNTVYYDAALSKLSYAGSAAADNTIPVSGGQIYFHAWNSESDLWDGTMELTNPHSSGSNTWSDVYKADLDKQYKYIIFYSGTKIGDYPSGSSASKTVDLEIPWNENAAPCFYGDTSDDAVYGTLRDGYWGEVYTIRNAEEAKNADVVDITSSSFTREANTLYVNSTFYDYYTDYELNGNNRDYYKGTNEASQRNWVTFRQFDQALSDAYAENSVAIPIYTGHFQPSITGWGNQFSAIASTLNLYGYDKYNVFMSTNNSTLDINGGQGKYSCAAWGLVSNTLSGGTLLTSDGEMALPHFDESFLTGNNSKNTVLGEVYHNVAFPFTKKDIDNNGVQYWYFDSAETTLAMRQDDDTGEYYLYNTGNQGWSQNVNSSGSLAGTDGVSNTYGFFPFNETSQATSGKNYNYGFGTKLEFTFRLTENGTVLDKDGKSVPITFTFSGDDDVWVFIDGELALDVGGAHGRVEGTLDFEKMKATVSAVKASAGSSESGNDVISSFSLQGDNADEHTLTMFYMERGMWESNMKISFNFPDENQLEVEKQVDKTDVNDLFKDLFDNQSLFSFEIKNLAAHFGTKEVDSDGNEITKQTVDLSASRCTSVSGNVCEETTKDDSTCVHWYASLEDKTGSYRDKRYGTIALNTEISLSGMSYLQFEYYYDYNDTPSLSNMYLQLVDKNGKVKGNITDYLSGKTYGAVTMAGKSWVTVRIDLSKLAEEKGFDETVAKIRFGYNYPRNIYLRNFTFYPESTTSSLTGFVTKQYAISDYGSAETGDLEVPVGAKYSSSNGKSYVIREDGMFVLANEETVTFRDQFRRGSYISLKEITNSELFDTSWTLYENGRAVTSMGTGKTVTNGTISSLSGVNSTSVNDGRTEAFLAGTEDGEEMQNAYDGTKPSEDTFVFRSYSDPDNTTAATKLKVVFTNKVKTGSLTIEKKAAYGTDNLEGTYSFNLVFSNVGGLGLESDAIEYPTIELKAGDSYTITGIPLGTLYTVTEKEPTDGSSLKEVLVNGKNIMDPETKGVTGIVDRENANVTATFKNTKKPMVNITLTKNWKNEDGSDLGEDLIPKSINIGLQKRAKGSEGAYETVKDFDTSYDENLRGIVWTPGYEGWVYTVYGLDKYVDYTGTDPVEYEYRFVELSDNGDVLEEDFVLAGFRVSYGEVAKDEQTGDFMASITNTLDVPKVSVYSIKIIKQDAEDSDQLLSGVEFKLEKLNEENGSYILDDTFEAKTGSTGGDGEADEKGVVQFKALESGYYRLTETKAADGYSLLKEPITVILDQENGCTVDGQAYTPTEETSEEKTITITVQNRKKFSFPSTGGYGTTYMILGGLALAGVALFMYRLQIRKKGGRASLK